MSLEKLQELTFEMEYWMQICEDHGKAAVILTGVNEAVGPLIDLTQRLVVQSGVARALGNPDLSSMLLDIAEVMMASVVGVQKGLLEYKALDEGTGEVVNGRINAIKERLESME
jgi:hypothetical protein